MKLTPKMKQIIVASKTRQARLASIKRILQHIPVKVTFDYWDSESDYDRGFERGRASVANEIRAILDKPVFLPAYEPGNTDNGKTKAERAEEARLLKLYGPDALHGWKIVKK